MSRVIKRDETIQTFDRRKVLRALLAAYNDVQPGNIPAYVNELVDNVEAKLANRDEMDVEEIQDAVIFELRREGDDKVADHYEQFRAARAALREKRLEPDVHAIRDFVAAGKYGMYRDDLGRYETWNDTLERCLTTFEERYPYLKGEIRAAFTQVFEGRVLPSMRMLQFGGRGVLQHNLRVFNCSFTLVNRLRAFQEIFFCLLAGCGVGFSVQHQHVEQLPPVKRIDPDDVVHFAISDDIEGWADSVGELIHSYFVTGSYVEFNYGAIRPRGARLSSSGGKAPGHQPLRKLHLRLRDFLDGCPHRKLRPIEVFDIVCMIAEAVLAGGVRRSSLIALFSPDDGEMGNAKTPGNYEWGGKNYWRRMANISAAVVKDEAKQSQVERLVRQARAYGEPGVAWLPHRDAGCNPCAEIGLYPRLQNPYDRQQTMWHPHGTNLGKLFDLELEKHQGVNDGHGMQHEVDASIDFDWREYTAFRENNTSDAVAAKYYGNDTGFQFCNLCEVNVAACSTEAQFYQACHAAAVIGTMQAGFTKMPYLGPVTERITEREALIGVGLTGMSDNPTIAFDGGILRRGATIVREVNAQMSALIGIRRAARCTTVKPSGTASLVLGCVGSGVHPHHARRYFRRVTEATTSPVTRAFIARNPHMVEKKPDGNLSITFCVKAPDAALTVKEMPAIEFLERVYLVYDSWVLPGTNPELCVVEGQTHNVSCTVVVSDDEWDAVIKSMWDNRRRVASLSFLPRMGDKGIPFIPREEVVTPADEERWQYLIENYRSVNYGDIRETLNRTAEPACSGGTCEI